MWTARLAPVLALGLAAIAGPLPLRRRRRVVVVVGDLAADDLAVERERLQDDVEACAVLMWKDQADVEPEIVLALAANVRANSRRQQVRRQIRELAPALVSEDLP